MRTEEVGMIRAEVSDFLSWDPDGYVPDLIYVDPPFNTDRDFGQYNDRWQGQAYEAFLAAVIAKAYEIISYDGNFILHLDWRSAHLARTIGDCVFGPKQFSNEIIWAYASGGASPKRLARKHDTLLVWSLGQAPFNVLREPYPHDYGDRPGFHPDGRMLTDVWNIPRLSNTAYDRSGYPTEKPPALMERIVTIFSDPGGYVLDPMCGGGTTLRAAAKLARNAVGLDINPYAIALTESLSDGH